jgi:DHA1 family bicyclomycin/chloramphenicol resistance-like MFS transporter
MRRFHPESLGFLLLLGSLGALPPLSIDMALPALTQIGAALHAPISAATLTLSLFMAGFAVAQLLFGPLSDRYGRRPILLAGCALFSVAGLACTVAPSIETLLTARFVQGCGAGSGMVIVFAMVRDLFEGAKARSRLSYVNLVLAIAPMIAPTLGAWILALGNWHWIYALLGAGGVLLTATIWIRLDESLARPDPTALQLGRLAANYGRMLGHRVAIGYVLINSLSFGCMFAYVAGSAFVMTHVLGLSAGHYALSFACTALGILLGAFTSGKLGEHHVPAHVPLLLGLGGALLGAALLIPVAQHGTLGVILPLLVVCTFCYGLVAPNAAHGALHPLPEIAGIAGASLGFFQMAGGAAASALVAVFNDGRSPLSMTLTMAGCALGASLLYAFMVLPAERRAHAADAEAATFDEAPLGD